MSSVLESAILGEATKLVVRHQTYASRLADVFFRIARRGQPVPTKVVHKPRHWSLDPGFDPYHVRANVNRIGHAVARAMRRGTYSPRTAVGYSVPKADGSLRDVSVFQVADNAVSRLVYKNLLAKNATQFSSHCYAYREDLTAHDAVSHMAAEFREHPRLFVAEFDFRKYFDNVAHGHLYELLDDRRFYITKQERAIIDAFLAAGTAKLETYPLNPVPRTRGFPQGTSISLFLANLAGYPLDKRLSRIGVGFARYADDTVIWSNDYGRVCQAVDALNDCCSDMGVAINLSKSEGISILAGPDDPTELEAKPAVSFVGYSIGRGVTAMKKDTAERAKTRIAKIIYTNLIEGPKAGVIDSTRLGNFIDRDYVAMIFQIRRYLYGGLSESKLKRFLTRAVPVMHYKGFMSYFPLVDDDAQLKALDGWLLHTVFTSLRARSKMLISLGYSNLPEPHGLTAKELIGLQGMSADQNPIDLRLPSFFRIARMFRKAVKQFGPNAVANPDPDQYYLG